MTIGKLSIFLITFTFLLISSLFADTTLKNIQVNTTCNPNLQLSYVLFPQLGAPDDGTLNFGKLKTMNDGTLGTWAWYRIRVFVVSNMPDWILTQNCTHLLSEVNQLPVGALKVIAPATNNISVAANGAGEITLMTNEHYDPFAFNHVDYGMPMGTIPHNQPHGHYTGTVTFTLTQV